jgi:hypothetical protein
MKLLYNTLPNFTAEASLLSSNSAIDGILNNHFDHITVSVNAMTTGDGVISASNGFCSGCTDCDPVTHTKECSHWDDRIDDCITTVRQCNPGPPCCSPPGCRICS